jgi:hypothetical protein
MGAEPAPADWIESNIPGSDLAGSESAVVPSGTGAGASCGKSCSISPQGFLQADPIAPAGTSEPEAVDCGGEPRFAEVGEFRRVAAADTTAGTGSDGKLQHFQGLEGAPPGEGPLMQ